MKKPKNVFVGAMVLFMLLGVAMPAGAQTSTSTLVAQIQSLLTQIQSLQQQLATLDSQRGAIVSDLRETIQLTRQLARGASGEDVATLQEILAADKEVYPEGLITGFFGPLTENAVKKFQRKHGIEQLGAVGPKTRAAIHAFLGNLSTSTASLPPGLAKKLAMNPASPSSLPISASTTPGATITICHYPPGNPLAKQTITIGLPAWQAHQKHGDTIGSCSGEVTPPPATTTPDTTAPILSNVIASTTASTSAIVSWNTNENADSTVWYGTTTPLDLAVALKLESESLKTSHALNLSGLATTTTYYYLVSSADSAGNRATSTESSFSTPN